MCNVFSGHLSFGILKNYYFYNEMFIVQFLISMPNFSDGNRMSLGGSLSEWAEWMKMNERKLVMEWEEKWYGSVFKAPREVRLTPNERSLELSWEKTSLGWLSKTNEWQFCSISLQVSKVLLQEVKAFIYRLRNPRRCLEKRRENFEIKLSNLETKESRF